MRVSAKAEYACRAMMELALLESKTRPVRARELAGRHGIPQNYLVQILLVLKGAGLVTSMRGANGGYRLNRTPNEITLGQIVRAIDGPTEVGAGVASPDNPVGQTLRGVWEDLRAEENRLIDAITLSELRERAGEAVERMYYI